MVNVLPPNPEPREPVPVERPTVEDVAALLRARTKDTDGHELGTFNDATRPTDAEVLDLIELAYGDVTTQTGADLEERTAAAATSMIALRAAMFVELSYFPEQVRQDRSAYEEYKRLYDEGMLALRAAIEGNVPGAGQFRFASVPLISSARAAWMAMGSVWPEPENPENWPDPFEPPASPIGDEPASGLERRSTGFRIGLNPAALRRRENL